MVIVIDTTAVIACLLNEPHREVLLNVSAGQELVAPKSLSWEIGNAFSAMFKRARIGIEEASEAMELFSQMAIDLRDIDIKAAVRLSYRLRIYAYEGYMIQCAVEPGGRILTLDSGLITAARASEIELIEVKS